MEYVNLIWDFDGMLFNTYPRMAAAFQKALKNLGVEAEFQDVMSTIKLSVRKGVTYYSEKYNLDRNELNRQYHEIEHSMPAETMVPYDGICDLLKAVVAAGGSHYLYTHRDHTAIEALERYGIRDLFLGAITALDPFPSKPAPDALLNLMDKHGLKPNETLMLGDRDIDVEAAKNAGICGCLFDPEHFYDAYENKMRTDTVEGLYGLLGVRKK